LLPLPVNERSAEPLADGTTPTRYAYETFCHVPDIIDPSVAYTVIGWPLVGIGAVVPYVTAFPK
jgi:hypothetical protein